jgi:hypothetical protein
MEVMTDEQWLRYFETHCRTERAGFVKQNLDHLCDLAGIAHFEDLKPGVIYSVYADKIDPIVAKARERMAAREAPTPI